MRGSRVKLLRAELNYLVDKKIEDPFIIQRRIRTGITLGIWDYKEQRYNLPTQSDHRAYRKYLRS